MAAPGPGAGTPATLRQAPPRGVAAGQLFGFGFTSRPRTTTVTAAEHAAMAFPPSLRSAPAAGEPGAAPVARGVGGAAPGGAAPPAPKRKPGRPRKVSNLARAAPGPSAPGPLPVAQQF